MPRCADSAAGAGRGWRRSRRSLTRAGRSSYVHRCIIWRGERRVAAHTHFRASSFGLFLVRCCVCVWLCPLLAIDALRVLSPLRTRPACRPLGPSSNGYLPVTTWCYYRELGVRRRAPTHPGPWWPVAAERPPRAAWRASARVGPRVGCVAPPHDHSAPRAPRHAAGAHVGPATAPPTGRRLPNGRVPPGASEARTESGWAWAIRRSARHDMPPAPASNVHWASTDAPRPRPLECAAGQEWEAVGHGRLEDDLRAGRPPRDHVQGGGANAREELGG